MILTAGAPGGAPPPPRPSDLVARWSAIEGGGLPAKAWGCLADDGWVVGGRNRTVVGSGTAAVLPLPSGLDDELALERAVAWLRAIDLRPHGSHGTATPRVVAVGAFPFDRGAPAALVVPRVAYCLSDDGGGWVVEVVPQGEDAAARELDHGREPERDHERQRDREHEGAGEREGEHAAEPVPGAGDVQRFRELPPGRAYADAVERALGEIAGGVVAKVVLARAVDVDLSRPPTASTLLQRLWGDDRAFGPYSIPVEGGRMVGASPELVVSRLGSHVTSHPLAGTVALDGTDDGTDDDAAGRLFGSEKDRAEHRFVVDAVADALAPLCERLTVPVEPSVVRLRSDARLGTLVDGTLRREGTVPGSGGTVLRLLSLLHPTPAVGGVPRSAAVRLITALEAVPRGHWAGVVGWVDADGDGEWMLAIRCALLGGRRARVYAGAGIVSGSRPEAELAETTLKLRPVLEALAPGWSAGLP